MKGASFSEELAKLKEEGLFREMRLVRGAQGARVRLEEREVLSLCSNNYLGLADHPLLQQASLRAVEAYGTGSGASRLVSGTMELHLQLEKRIARFKDTESAILFNSGYMANTGAIGALVGRGDSIFSDRLNHASIVDGCLLSRAEFVRYPHNDMNSLRRLLSRAPEKGRRLIVTDGVFSMDGDIAPLRELVQLKEEFGALLMVDDAHGTGVLGATGRGSAEACGVVSHIDIHMGTFGKALGSFGAYVAASEEIISLIVNKGRSFIFSTALPPAVVAASLAAIDLVESPEGDRLRARLAHNSRLFRTELARAGFDTLGSVTQIVPIVVGEAGPTMDFARRLLDAAVFIQGIRPPTVPRGSCRLRGTLMATHTDEDVAEAVAAIETVGRHIGII